VGFPRRHPILTVLLLIVLGIAGIIAWTASAVWRAAHTDDARRVGHADLIAVLGAAQYSGRPSPVLEGRLQQAALLYQKGFAPRILLLGGKRPGDITTEAETGRQWLISDGIPESAVFAAPEGNDTIQSIRAAAAFMKANHLRSVFLVSDPWHNLRIRRMASDLGLVAYVSATWHSAARSSWTRLSGYTRETFAYLRYRILGH
jgi:uncharacterized SAM-binding protein YcdF (DUF218 family)